MVKPNSFYRFEQGWSAGFYPDNQIVSDLLNEFYVNILTAFPVIAQPGLSTIPYLKQVLNQAATGYNAYPYFGNFSVSLDLVDQVTYYDFTFTVRDEGLYVVDNTQEFTITGQATLPGKVLLPTPVLSSFTPGSYTGTFDKTLINEEKKIAEALEVVYQNGSALFPITYSYNPTTKIATSGLARGADWKLWNDIEPNRTPYPTQPRTNQRTFSLPELNSDDRYIVSVMERIIQASLENADYTTSVLAAINSYAVPDGWTLTIIHPAFTTYERVQVNYVDNSGRRKFILVGRKDSTWLWQRFVSDDNNAAYNFFSSYVETDALPYEPNQAGRWLYNNDTFDFEFVEFTSGCYESEEFYPMPAKPGDQWQFNIDIQDANLTGLTSVDVGLFTESGQFVQKIGNGSILSGDECCYVTTIYTIYVNEVEPGILTFSDFLDFINSFEGGIPCKFYFSNQTENYTGTSTGTLMSEQLGDFILQITGPITTAAQFIAVVEAQSWPFGITVTGEIVDNNGFEGVRLTFCNMQESEYPSIVVLFEVPEVSLPNGYIFTNYIDSITNASCGCQTQMQSSVTIPSKNGCYRMGLYNEPATSCELEFEYVIEDYSAWLTALCLYTPNYCAIGIWDGSAWTSVYGFQITDDVGTTGDAFLATFNVPGEVSAILDSEADTMTITWTATVPCVGEYNMKAVVTDVDFETVLDGLWQTPEQSCDCETSLYLYSLSNIINIDASDCFSTMIEFWSDNNTMNSGFEYFNNWQQKVRLGINGGGDKPVIEESLYRQSNGVHRRPQSKQDLSLDLHTDFLDLPTQLALVDATRHPYLVWNGKNIFVKGDIEVATTQDYTTQTSFETLAQVKFQALLQGFQPRNSSCLTC